MIYIIKKMYEAFGDYVDIYPELRGIKPIFNKIEIKNNIPDNNDVIASLEYAAKIHKEIRRNLQSFIKPNVKMTDIANFIETKTEELAKQANTINKGIGFPVGLSINECAAHRHPSINDNTILKKSDIIKIDYGIEINEWIIDSAFTVYFDPKYDILATAVREATYTGIKNIGVDVNIGEWGKQIQEVMESYEITFDNKIYPIKSITNLGGHNIVKGIIHGGIFLPTVDMGSRFNNFRFEEGVYAVETFGSTGDNITFESGIANLYRLNPNKYSTNNLKLESTKKLLQKIKKSFNTLPFTDRYLQDFNSYKTHLNILANNNIIHTYPPLCVNEGAYTAQYEHTVYIADNKKIIFSEGEDY